MEIAPPDLTAYPKIPELQALNQYNCKGSCLHSLSTGQFVAVLFTPRTRLKEHKCLFCNLLLNSLPSRKYYVPHTWHTYIPAAMQYTLESQSKVCSLFLPLLGQQGKHALPPLLEPKIFAVWNPPARIRQNKNYPTWLTDLECDIPEVRWCKATISNDPVLDARHTGIETGFKKFEKLPSDQQHTPRQHCPKPTAPPTTNRVEPKADGSCHMHHGRRVVGAGVYHPDNDVPIYLDIYVQPNGAGITYTVVRGVLAAKVAAILQSHSQIPIDSYSSQHQLGLKLESKHCIQTFTVSMSKAVSLK
eukprot:564426-Pelagomonas_calceolata.AAC.1